MNETFSAYWSRIMNSRCCYEKIQVFVIELKRPTWKKLRHYILPASPFHSTTTCNVYAARYQITRLMKVRVNKALIKQLFFHNLIALEWLSSGKLVSRGCWAVGGGRIIKKKENRRTQNVLICSWWKKLVPKHLEYIFYSSHWRQMVEETFLVFPVYECLTNPH